MAMEQFNNVDLNFERNFLVRLNFGWVDNKLIYLGFVSALSSLFLFAPHPSPHLPPAPEAFPMPFASVSPLLLHASMLVTNTLLLWQNNWCCRNSLSRQWYRPGGDLTLVSTLSPIGLRLYLLNRLTYLLQSKCYSLVWNPGTPILTLAHCLSYVPSFKPTLARSSSALDSEAKWHHYLLSIH